ncbi:MAG: hypothetical protein ACYTDW_15280 [Planctomycetota bacterium]
MGSGDVLDTGDNWLAHRDLEESVIFVYPAKVDVEGYGEKLSGFAWCDLHGLVCFCQGEGCWGIIDDGGQVAQLDGVGADELVKAGEEYVFAKLVLHDDACTVEVPCVTLELG